MQGSILDSPVRPFLPRLILKSEQVASHMCLFVDNYVRPDHRIELDSKWLPAIHPPAYFYAGVTWNGARHARSLPRSKTKLALAVAACLRCAPGRANGTVSSTPVRACVRASRESIMAAGTSTSPSNGCLARCTWSHGPPDAYTSAGTPRVPSSSV
jgi:hypothetical protein